MIERVFTIASGVLLVVALVMLWRNNLSAAFVIGAVGAVAWFLGFRAQLRTKIRAEAPPETDDDINEDD